MHQKSNINHISLNPEIIFKITKKKKIYGKIIIQRFVKIEYPITGV